MYVLLGIEPRALELLQKCSTSESQPSLVQSALCNLDWSQLMILVSPQHWNYRCVPLHALLSLDLIQIYVQTHTSKVPIQNLSILITIRDIMGVGLTPVTSPLAGGPQEDCL